MNPWIVLAIFIATYDGWLIASGRPSLSNHYAATSRQHPVLISAATAYLLAHLYGVLPRRTDVLYGFGLVTKMARRGD